MKGSLRIWCACLLLSAVAVQAQGGQVRRVVILMFSEETRYADAARGVQDQMRESGLGAPGVAFVIDHAGANKARAAELVQKAIADKPDLICALGTSMTTAISREVRDIPIVFSMVYDPVAAGIAKAWLNSGNNTTGTSSHVPMGVLVERLRAFAPVKKLAVLYTPGEKNSEAQLKDLQAEQAGGRIAVTPVPLSRKEDIADILPDVIRTSDALYLTGSNLVDSEVAQIVEAATRGSVITITHLDDLVAKGVLIGVSANSYQLGRQAGRKAVRILRGAKPSSLPIEKLEKFDLLLNMKTVKAGGFRVPPEFQKSVTRVVQ